MVKKLENGTIADADEVMENLNKGWSLNILNKIRQNIDRVSVISSGQDDIFTEAYVDVNGQNNSVNTTNTTASFNTNKYLVGGAWGLSTGSYDGVSFSVNSQDQNPWNLFIGSDGGKMYIVGEFSDKLYQYTLGSPWDLSTASYDSGSDYNLGLQDAAPRDIFFKPDGLKAYHIGTGGGNPRIYQYTLSTAWNIGTMTYDSVYFDLSGQGFAPYSIYISSNGSNFYTTDITNDYVYQYVMSTAWDITSGSYTGSLFDTSSQDTDAMGIFFKPELDAMYIVGNGNTRIYQYTLSTPGDVSTASYDNISFSTSSQDSDLTGVFFKDDGDKFYTTGNTNASVYQYSIASGSVIEHTIPSGTFNSTPSKLIAKSLYEDWETGVSVQHKIQNATEDSGWINDGELGTFTAFTSEPTKYLVSLTGVGSTLGYPSIRGSGIYTE